MVCDTFKALSCVPVLFVDLNLADPHVFAAFLDGGVRDEVVQNGAALFPGESQGRRGETGGKAAESDRVHALRST